MLRAEEPHHAIGTDRPAAARTGVLHHQLSLGRGRHAYVRQLEGQAVARALGIETPQAQVDRVRQVARPHVGPLQAGLEAVAGNRLAVVERAVTDRGDRILPEVVLRHREQAVEQGAGGIDGQRLLADHALAVGPRHGGGALRVGTHADVHAMPVQSVVPGRRCRQRGSHRGGQQRAQHALNPRMAWGRVRIMLGLSSDDAGVRYVTLRLPPHAAVATCARTANGRAP